jgi:hydroxymethylpyrimidine/phosphomethylpyrimidine kinase
MKIALTIAGSDSGGGAGIQADLKTFHQFGVFGTSAIVALTAQNTVGVRAVEQVSPAMIEAQLIALAEDLPPDAVKTGMLGDAATVRQIAAVLERYQWRRYVLDPVMVSSSGDRLLTPEAERVLRESLAPRALLITPNLDEAAILTGDTVSDPVSMERAGRALVEMGAHAALIKGGHLTGTTLVDLLVTRDGVRHYRHPRIDTRSTHGTGCTLSAAITAGLALKQDLERSVLDALDYVHRAIKAAPRLGSGHGPLNHNVPPYPSPDTAERGAGRRS